MSEAVEVLKGFVEQVERGDFDAYTAARIAVFCDLLLIGGTESQPVHYPVDAKEHTYFDLNRGIRRPYVREGRKALRASGVAEFAIICALFGDINSREQRAERARLIDPTRDWPDITYGWGADALKTFDLYGHELAFFPENAPEDAEPTAIARGIAPYEKGAVRTHALPPLINAARDPDNPLCGVIDFVKIGDPAGWQLIPHEAGAWVTAEPRETVLTMPVRGYLDFPLDAVPIADYANIGGSVS